MKIFLIRTGKVFSAIRRDGFRNGMKRVISSIRMMLRPVGRGDILFVSGGMGDSALYRCFHVAEELELHGFKCSIALLGNPFLVRYVDRFKVFIFHRALYTPKVEKMIGRIKEQGKEIVFETDDLVYDPKYLEHMDYYKNMNVFERSLYDNGVGGEILRDPYVKVCTTTTSFLAEKLGSFGKKVFIVRNKLSRRDLKFAERALVGKEKRRDDGKVRIGYFSGTMSHNKDFATISDALLDIMEKHPNTELILVGPLEIENKLNKFKHRIRQLGYVKREEHFANIASVDINLAPLEIGNPFCESKSELKFFEAGIVGVPTVAVANQTFSEAMEEGRDGFLANNQDEWIRKVGLLVQDADLRKRVGEAARRKTLEKYAVTSQHIDSSYYDFLKHKIR